MPYCLLLNVGNNPPFRAAYCHVYAALAT